jgi:hypothetical protein
MSFAPDDPDFVGPTIRVLVRNDAPIFANFTVRAAFEVRASRTPSQTPGATAGATGTQSEATARATGTQSGVPNSGDGAKGMGKTTKIGIAVSASIVLLVIVIAVVIVIVRAKRRGDVKHGLLVDEFKKTLE